MPQICPYTVKNRKPAAWISFYAAPHATKRYFTKINFDATHIVMAALVAAIHDLPAAWVFMGRRAS
jgi:hypothetical protein